MIYLLDTNVLSEQRRPTPDPGVEAWLGQMTTEELRVSVVTIGEIRRGITRLELRNDHRQAAFYETWFDATKRLFADCIVPITAEVAEKWGERDARRSIPTAGGLIGATAEIHGWTMVTRNTKDFRHTGVRLLDPFTG
ncbi:MAG: type II toxin-antitoxin system VapC family toxin [Pseudonocardia sp.]